MALLAPKFACRASNSAHMVSKDVACQQLPLMQLVYCIVASGNKALHSMCLNLHKAVSCCTAVTCRSWTWAGATQQPTLL